MRTQKLHKAKQRSYYWLGGGSFTVAVCRDAHGKTTRSWSRVTCKNCLRRKP